MNSFATAEPTLLPSVNSGRPQSFKRQFVFSLTVLYYLPPLLLAIGILRFTWRFEILAAMTIVMLAYDWRHGLGLKELGFRRDTLKGSLLLNLSASLLLAIVLLLSFKAGLIRAPLVPGWKLFFAYYLFISGPSQEFLFRSNLFALMKRNNFEGPAIQILVSSITFSFLHIFYWDPIVLVVTFIIGVLWGGIYYKYPNFWGVAFSHSILGATAIMVGLI